MLKFKKNFEVIVITKDFPKHEKTEDLPLHDKQKEISEKPKEKQISHEEHKLLTEAKTKELEEIIKRLQAEFENYQKRTQKEYAEKFDLGKMDFAKSMLLFADEFEHALSMVKGEERKGIEMIHNSFKKTLESQGIRQMDYIGKKYDPYNHDVIKQEESDKEDGVILHELKKGYFFKDKVLRHAQVVVSKKKHDKNQKLCTECE